MTGRRPALRIGELNRAAKNPDTIKPRMFVGHFALGYAAKRVAPRTSLAVLFAAAQLADTMWPVLVAFGIERVSIDPGNTVFTPLDFVSYPYSHSLAALIVWGLLFGILCAVVSPGLKTGPTYRSGSTIAVIAALVVSHWVLDWITHRPDMPIYPGGPKVGLGLWNSVPATLAMELVMFAIGVAIYTRSTRPRDGIGRWSHVALVAALLAFYALNIIGGPPPSVTAIWCAGLAGAVLIFAWSSWSDKHRFSV
jgi:hypothetical protein